MSGAGDVELEAPADPCADCARRGDTIQALASAALVAVFVGFSVLIYRHVTKPPDYDAILDAAERRELLREAAAGDAPPEA